MAWWTRLAAVAVVVGGAPSLWAQAPQGTQQAPQGTQQAPQPASQPSAASAQSPVPGPATSQSNAEGEAAVKEVDVAAGAFSRGEPAAAWVEELALPPADGSQPVVIRLSDAQFLVGAQPVNYVRFAVTVNDVSMLTSAGQISIPFVPQYQKLKLHAVTVYRGPEKLDRTASMSVRFLQREQGLEKGVYSDVVTASLLVNDLRAGDTLEYAYSLEGQNPVFGNKFVDQASWDMPFPTALRRVVLNHPASRKIAWKTVGEAGSKTITPTETQDGDMRRLVFEETAIPEVAAEQGAPSDYVAYRWLHFSEFADWKDVATWANALFVATDTGDAELRQVIDKLRAAPSDEERIAAALAFVQGEIRYFSVSLGESSHRPTQPGIVLQRRYGDCKDKSLLLITILRDLGIDSHAVLLSVGRRKGLDKSLASPEVFDHAIVEAKVKGKTYYLDATRLGQQGRLDRMGQVHEGADALIVDAATAKLATITSRNAGELARSELSERIELPVLEGDARLKSRQVWRGATAESMRMAFQQISRERINKSFADAMEARYTGARLIGEPVVEDDRAGNVLVISTEFTLPKPASAQDDYWFVRFSPSNMAGVFASSQSTQRTAPLQIPSFPFEGKYTIEVAFPDGVNATTDPFTYSVRSRHFTYTATTNFRRNVGKTTIAVKTLSDRIEARDLKGYADKLGDTNKNIGSALILPKRYAKSKKVAGKKASPALADVLRAQAKDGIERLTETIKTGGLSDDDLANAYCERSVRHLYLSQQKEAKSDMEEAARLAPNSPPVLSCRAWGHFYAGEFDKSVADYSLALSFGDTSGDLYQARGLSRFYAGQLEAAAQDFVKASDKLDQETRVVNDIWLSVAHMRLGKPLPTDLMERAAADPRGDWPRPALAAVTGKLAPEELIKLITARKTDEMASAEGYFFLGQLRLAAGDTAKAREFFDKTRQLDMINNRAVIAAAHELKALPPAGAPPEPPPSPGRVISPLAATAPPAAPAAAAGQPSPAAARPTATGGRTTPAATSKAPATTGSTTPAATTGGSGSPATTSPPPAATGDAAGAAQLAQPKPPAKPARKKRTARDDPDWNTRPLQ